MTGRSLADDVADLRRDLAAQRRAIRRGLVLSAVATVCSVAAVVGRLIVWLW
jgi:hypothetical protein